ncbi:metallophosphoesterase [Lacticaseibacillus pabuli]|uniref:Metallophosphoesterase n=1 Tax=Lacticaseibacillus pabuli TaxID=3025672 RepID=A0ABY7WTJ0_9LACO|nr:metallophosphoesterase [Lacticaseibacillus sp. KACC 23028]WDF83431.1 metallophosphoesterase [Lacticaseibacillus sp. KACC 23028]
MRIAISSDNHFDVNKVDSDAAMVAQADYLRAHQYDYYLNAGDTFNDFRKTQAFYMGLQRLLGADVQVRYVAGNHDMIRGVDYTTLQTMRDPLYLHRTSEALPGTNWQLIGNNGWYDYSFAGPGLSAEEILHWKKAYWVDSVIDQPQSDPKRMDAELAILKHQLDQADGRPVLLLTHFVPDIQFLDPKMRESEMGGKAAALLGSQRLGNLLAQYPDVTAAFGHLHRRDLPQVMDGVQYLHSPVGYGTKRHHEWVSDDFMTEWVNSLQTVEI